jgi:hypothetical protein
VGLQSGGSLVVQVSAQPSCGFRLNLHNRRDAEDALVARGDLKLNQHRLQIDDFRSVAFGGAGWV